MLHGLQPLQSSMETGKVGRVLADGREFSIINSQISEACNGNNLVIKEGIYGMLWQFVVDTNASRDSIFISYQTCRPGSLGGRNAPTFQNINKALSGTAHPKVLEIRSSS
ncbi:hypothetical protein EVAR_53911_1 [Eumeta japonica]|uniref:Uncharacterized protein n=1 Tax=Eumeta variegata TaxID=151549 RepID=A0A4C1YMJ8_EUMVA|nr:hypothetical protein EVAR_53911_1 [Eumeta japonica]